MRNIKKVIFFSKFDLDVVRTLKNIEIKTALTPYDIVYSAERMEYSVDALFAW